MHTLISIMLETLHCMIILTAIGAPFIFIRAAYTRFKASTFNSVGAREYTHARLEKLAYDSTHSIPLFIIRYAILRLYEKTTNTPASKRYKPIEFNF